MELCLLLAVTHFGSALGFVRSTEWVSTLPFAFNGQTSGGVVSIPIILVLVGFAFVERPLRF